jgi:3D (Asp-Asp-Asp) domain-containing protein
MKYVVMVLPIALLTACDDSVKDLQSKSNRPFMSHKGGTFYTFGSSGKGFFHSRRSDEQVPQEVQVITERELQKSAAVRSEQPDRQKSARATIYFVPRENDPRYAGSKSARVYLAGGGSVAVTPAFKRELVVQGTGILADGRTVNIWRNGLYKVVQDRYGQGTHNMPLVPFRSVAIDKRYYGVKNGDHIFIPSTKGMLIPGTSIIHDGYWVVSDIGGDIKGPRVDLFSGTMHWRDFQNYLRNSENFDANGIAAGSQFLGDRNRTIKIYI